MKWKSIKGERIVDGMILRIMNKNSGHKNYKKYEYGIASGGGFGCDPDARGSAIMIDFESMDLDKVLQNQRNRSSGKDWNELGTRWEKCWDGIQILIQKKKFKKGSGKALSECRKCGELYDIEEKGTGMSFFHGVPGTCVKCHAEDQAEIEEENKVEEGA